MVSLGHNELNHNMKSIVFFRYHYECCDNYHLFMSPPLGAGGIMFLGCFALLYVVIGLFSEPLPMRLRALPQSFWQQPNVPHNVPPSTTYPILPPLYGKEGEEGFIGEQTGLLPSPFNSLAPGRFLWKFLLSNFQANTVRCCYTKSSQ